MLRKTSAAIAAWRKAIKTSTVILAVLLAAYSFGAAEGSQSLTILYTSDLGAQYQAQDQPEQFVPGWARLSAAIESIRSEVSSVLLLDPGDYLDEKQILCQENPRVIMQMLNGLRYDALGIGMDELNWGSEGALSRVKEAKIPIVCTNMVSTETGDLFFWPHWAVDHGAVRVGILGVTSPAAKKELVGMHLQDVTIQPPAEAIQAHLEKLTPIVDLLVVLSYMDDEANRELARAVPEIDVIVSGFAHPSAEPPFTEGQTIITHAGRGAGQLGQLNIEVAQGRIQDWEHQFISVGLDTPSAEPFSGWVEEAAVAENILLSEVVGQATAALVGQKSQESPLGNWITDCLRLTAGADVAFENTLGIRGDLKSGLIKRGDLFGLNYYNTILRFELTGAQIMEILELNCTERNDFLQVSGVTYVYDPQSPEGKRVTEAHIDGTPIRPRHRYQVATNHFVGALAERYFGFPLPAYENTGISLYESQVQALKDNPNISVSSEKRIRTIPNHSSR